MAKYSGRGGTVYMSTTGTGTAVPVVALNRWSISMTADRFDVTEFGANNKQTVQGFRDATGRISGFWNDAESTPFTAAQSADGTKLYLYPANNAPARYFALPAWLDITNFETPVNGPVTLEAGFSANGTLVVQM